MQRGGCTFAQKVLRAQGAGAVAVIIIQTMDIWPYTMTDSSGESRVITIPAFMMSTKHGTGYVLLHLYDPLLDLDTRKLMIDRFVEYLRTKSHEMAIADIVVRRDARECVICQVDMTIGMEVTRMPCQVRRQCVTVLHHNGQLCSSSLLVNQHLFHTDCLHAWFKVGNSCPICRVEIAAKRSATRGATSQSAQERGDFSWSDWFS